MNHQLSFSTRAHIWIDDYLAQLLFALVVIFCGLILAGILYLIGWTQALIPGLILVAVAADLIRRANQRPARRERGLAVLRGRDAL